MCTAAGLAVVPKLKFKVVRGPVSKMHERNCTNIHGTGVGGPRGTSEGGLRPARGRLLRWALSGANEAASRARRGRERADVVHD